MKLNEIRLSLESEHGVNWNLPRTTRPTQEEAKKALEVENPVKYAREELKVVKAPDSTPQAVIRYLKDIAEGF